MSKKFLVQFEINTGSSDLHYMFLDDGESVEECQERNEVEHDESGLDTEDSPIGGAEGQYTTELISVEEVTPKDRKVLQKFFRGM